VNSKTVVLGSVVAVVSLMFVVLLAVSGCGKEQPTAQKTQATESMPMHEHAAMPMNEQAATDQAAVKTVATEQTTCPIMGNPINKDVFVEYKGKKVYFCCKGCPDQFLANPEKYIAQLPQFQQ
jgi:YHS domain-containing protein